jgi:hypothetical protein
MDTPTADPNQFRVHHPSDDPAYKTIDELNREHKLAPLSFPPPRGIPEPVLTLAEVLGRGGDDAVKRIEGQGQLSSTRSAILALLAVLTASRSSPTGDRRNLHRK